MRDCVRVSAAAALVLGATACGANPGPTGVPPNRGNTNLDRFIRSELPQGELPGCVQDPASPGLMWSAPLGLGRYVPLPRTFVTAPPLESEVGKVLGGNYTTGVRWRPGLGFRGGGQVWVTSDLSTMIRFGPEGYTDLVLGGDWALSASHECTMPIAGAPARVLRFELRSAANPTQHGLTAHWRTRSWRSGVLILSDTREGVEELALSLQLITP
ncbi:MAG TPA: hypothetical protein VF862_05810 [Gemmatimonadales bacterium]